LFRSSLSSTIIQKNPNVMPEVIRSGHPFRVPGMGDVRRYPRDGFDHPKASDHCPVGVENKFIINEIVTPG
jgi:hypothetical protein